MKTNPKNWYFWIWFFSQFSVWNFGTDLICKWDVLLDYGFNFLHLFFFLSHLQKDTNEEKYPFNQTPPFQNNYFGIWNLHYGITIMECENYSSLLRNSYSKIWFSYSRILFGSMHFFYQNKWTLKKPMNLKKMSVFLEDKEKIFNKIVGWEHK